jgi:hypothetical protein
VIASGGKRDSGGQIFCRWNYCAFVGEKIGTGVGAFPIYNDRKISVRRYTEAVYKIKTI